MPTLDRRLLSWSDSDTENDEQGHTPTRSCCSRAVDDHASSYDRCSAPAFVDDVLVPREVAEDDGRGVTVSGTRKAACAAAGFVAVVGCLCAYLAWRCRTYHGLASGGRPAAAGFY